MDWVGIELAGCFFCVVGLLFMTCLLFLAKVLTHFSCAGILLRMLR